MTQLMRAFLIAGLLALLPVSLLASTDNSSSNSTITAQQLGKMPLAFTANQGQWDEKIKFRANAGGATMWFTSDGAHYQFTRAISQDESQPGLVDQAGPVVPIHLMEDRMDHEPQEHETIMIKANFVGANPNPQMSGVEMMEYKCNYFFGNDPNEWHTDVPNYSAVLYEQVYDGIDLKYYGNGQQMEYDFIVEPGADFSQIRIEYEGAESISVNSSGELVVETKWGEVIEQKPVIYQMENDRRVAIVGEYSLKGTSAFGFELENYDPALPLVIDPVLVYSTYLGGANEDQILDLAIDTSGAVYVTGRTFSADFPTLNPYQTDQVECDAFITKLSSSGSLVYSTYLGGSGGEASSGLAIDASGAVYLSGPTGSADFPILNPYQGTFVGSDVGSGGSDVFITKLSSSGNSLIYSTYLGGNSYENIGGIAVDADGAAYIAGRTKSTDFPMLNPYQGTFQGSANIYLTKLSSSGSSLIYSTYIGGTESMYDRCTGLAVDTSGAVYLTGFTESDNFPPTFNAYQGTYQGHYDAFLTKFSSSGNSLIYSTYFGGSGTEYSYDIAVDADGAAYITGYSNSTDFPILNPYQDTCLRGDAFVTKFSSTGNRLIYSTYLGGGGYDWGNGIAVDASGKVYVTGYTMSSNFPTLNPYQGTFQGGVYDAFVTMLNRYGNNLVYSTYLGGATAGEQGRRIAVDADGAAYVAGFTFSTDFPTYNAIQDTFLGGNYDAFITKLSAPVTCGLYTGGFTGNTDCDIEGKRNLADITRLIDAVYITKDDLCCVANGNANGDFHGLINLADVTRLIDHVYISKVETAACL